MNNDWTVDKISDESSMTTEEFNTAIKETLEELNKNPIEKVSYEKVLNQLLFDKDNNRIGYVTNCYLEYNMRLTTQIPYQIHIATNMYDKLEEIEGYEEHKGKIKLYKPRVEVTNDNYYCLKILDAYSLIFNRYGDYKDSNYFNNAIDKIIEFAIQEPEKTLYLYYVAEEYKLSEATNIHGYMYFSDFIEKLCRKQSLVIDYKNLLKDVPKELHSNIKRLLDKLPSEYRDYRKCTIEHGPLGNSSIAILKYNITENLTGRLFTIELGIPQYGDNIRVDWYIAKHKVREVDIFIFKEMRISRFENFTLFRFMESNKDYLTYTKDYLDKKRKGLLENE